MNIRIILILSIFFLFNACNGKVPGADARKIPPNAKDRVKKNIEEGRGFTMMGSIETNKTGEFDFASSNELWRASLDTLEFMPLSLANYSGGIIVTDWYNDNNNNESVKISVRFLSNQIRSDALSIKVFYKQCGIQENCRIEDRSEILSTDLAEKILTKAAVYEKQNTSKKKKPYIGEIK